MRGLKVERGEEERKQRWRRLPREMNREHVARKNSKKGLHS